jgi:hypothetical protein
LTLIWLYLILNNHHEGIYEDRFFDSSGLSILVENDDDFSAIMIGIVTLDFLFATAARFGYGSNGSDVRCGVLPSQSGFLSMRNNIQEKGE